MTSHGKYPTAARHGWGKTAMLLHPKLASLGKLGKFGGRLDPKPVDDDKIGGKGNIPQKVDPEKVKELIDKSEEREF